MPAGWALTSWPRSDELQYCSGRSSVYVGRWHRLGGDPGPERKTMKLTEIVVLIVAATWSVGMVGLVLATRYRVVGCARCHDVVSAIDVVAPVLSR
jgi:hypothetical protein